MLSATSKSVHKKKNVVIHPMFFQTFIVWIKSVQNVVDLSERKSYMFGTLLKMKVLYLHLRFHEGPLTSMETFHSTNTSL